MRMVSFPVRGSTSSGTVIHWAPYRNWAPCAWCHFRYGALPVPVRSFTGPRTETGLHAHGPISGTRLCQFRYGHSLGPVPKLGSMRIVPFPVRGSSSSGTVIPVPELDSMLGGYNRWLVCGFVVSLHIFLEEQ
jgi:hypothetical protein